MVNHPFRKVDLIVTSGTRRLRAPAILLAALAALLVFAAAAAAETRTGESTTPASLGSLSPEGTLVRTTASYEVGTGAAVFNVTMGSEAIPHSKGVITAALTTNANCTTA